MYINYLYLEIDIKEIKAAEEKDKKRKSGIMAPVEIAKILRKQTVEVGEPGSVTGN